MKVKGAEISTLFIGVSLWLSAFFPWITVTEYSGRVLQHHIYLIGNAGFPHGCISPLIDFRLYGIILGLIFVGILSEGAGYIFPLFIRSSKMTANTGGNRGKDESEYGAEGEYCKVLGRDRIDIGNIPRQGAVRIGLLIFPVFLICSALMGYFLPYLSVIEGDHTITVMQGPGAWIYAAIYIPKITAAGLLGTADISGVNSRSNVSVSDIDVGQSAEYDVSVRETRIVEKYMRLCDFGRISKDKTEVGYH